MSHQNVKKLIDLPSGRCAPKMHYDTFLPRLQSKAAGHLTTYVLHIVTLASRDISKLYKSDLYVSTSWITSPSTSLASLWIRPWKCFCDSLGIIVKLFTIASSFFFVQTFASFTKTGLLHMISLQLVKRSWRLRVHFSDSLYDRQMSVTLLPVVFWETAMLSRFNHICLCLLIVPNHLGFIFARSLLITEKAGSILTQKKEKTASPFNILITSLYIYQI